MDRIERNGEYNVNQEDLIVKICGSAGDGAISATEILNRAVASMGYHIMNFDSFPAEIRGFGKSCGHTRISKNPVRTPGDKADCLVALDDMHSITELKNLKSNGIIIYDSQPPFYRDEDTAVAGFIEPGMVGYGVPLRELSTEATRSAKSRNLVSLGVIVTLFNFDPEFFTQAIARRFAGKKESVRTAVLEAFRLGQQFASSKISKRDAIDFERKVYPREGEYLVISGNESAAHGCLDAGVHLYAGYPITPATKIMEILAKKLPNRDGVVVQTEDEISAVGHVLGAGFAGKRSATATSGPGLCLMSECINLGVMAEIPMVIIDCQRGGPSTGLPTKTEQSDLRIAMFGASGDSPRPVLAPTTVAECHSLAMAAFEISEAYQTPVLLLLDFFLSNRIEDVVPNRAGTIGWGRFHDSVATPGTSPYKRYRITQDGVSPRSIPGTPDLFFTATGLEHTENGKPNYDAANHKTMTEKRYAKLDALREVWTRPEPIGDDGELDIGIISWGSSAGSAIEASESLRARGLRVGGLIPRLLMPLHDDAVEEFAARSRCLVVVEMNHTGQLADVIERIVHRPILRITKVYSEPIPSGDIVRIVLGELS